MNYSQAIKIAIGCIDRKIQRLAVNANLLDQFGLDTPATAAASLERKRLREARKILQDSPKLPKIA